MGQGFTTSNGDPVPPRATRGIEDRKVRVVLEIVRGGPCLMDDLEGDIVDVDVRLGDGRCHCDVSVREPGDSRGVVTKYGSRPICDHCPGTVFSEYGCLPRYKRVGDGWFVMETCVSDTETVAEIVGEIREICERVTVRSIVPIETQAVSDICNVDVAALTTKQRQAVHAAVEAGYYDSDSSPSLSQVAERLSLSSSALSQRLRRAEANVMRQLSEGCLGSESGSCVCRADELVDRR